MAPTAGASCNHSESLSSTNPFEDIELNEVGLPVAQGLYNPENEKDACGVGFVVNIDGKASRKVGKR